MKDKSWKSRV